MNRQDAAAPGSSSRQRYGGILCDIASHQADQFLFFTGSTQAEVAGCAGGQCAPSAVSRAFEDLRRHDAARRWRCRLHPRRLVHARRARDLGRRAIDDPRHRWLHRGPQEHRSRRSARAASHLFLVDEKETRYVDCSEPDVTLRRAVGIDVLNRTETAMSQAHCFLATELALEAQKHAQRLNLKV